MPVQVVDREQIRRRVATEINRATSLFFGFKREGQKDITVFAPLNLNIPDLRDLIKIIEGEISFRQKMKRDRMGFLESGLSKLKGMEKR